MESWELDFEWLRLRHAIKERFGRQDLPDLNAVLFITGLQECGQLQEKYTKEDKQDLMHIAVCRLFEEDGYYEFEGIDEDGWPHFAQVKKLDFQDITAQEQALKLRLVHYYKEILVESEKLKS